MVDIVINKSMTVQDIKEKYAKRLNVDINELMVVTKGNDALVGRLGDKDKLDDIDSEKLYTIVYHVPAP
jgi:hypothetical protein